jgi:hypothetical protein
MRPVRLSAKLRPVGEDAFEEEDFGPVAFVPLVGAEGWPEKGEPRPPKSMPRRPGLPLGSSSRSNAQDRFRQA